MKWGLWSTTAASNSATPPDGWPEGQAPSTVNDCAREMMAAIRTGLSDMQYIDQGHSPTQTGNVTFTVPGDQTAFYDYGRRIKAMDATTQYGTVISSTFTTNTGVTLRLEAGGVLTASLSAVGVGVLGQSNAVPDTVYRNGINAIHNSVHDVWQRGDGPFSISSSSGVILTADRWRAANGGSGIMSVTRGTGGSSVPTLAQVGVLVTGSLVVTCTSVDTAVAAGDFAYIEQIVEGYDYRQIAQKPTTISFWMNTNKSGTYCVSFQNTANDRGFVAEVPVTTVGAWQKKIINIPEHPSAGTWNYSSGVGLRAKFMLMAGANFQMTPGAWSSSGGLATVNQVNFFSSASNTLLLSAFKLEEGNEATPITNIAFADELNHCKRHFEIIDNLAIGIAISTSSARVDLMMQVEKASTPAIAFSSSILTDSAIGGFSVSAVASNVITNTTKIILNVAPVGTPLVVPNAALFTFSRGDITAATLF